METGSVDLQLARLLIVDDDPANLMLLRRIFDRDYSVDCAQNGQEALVALAQGSCDLVLLDIMMPKINGLQLLQIIRSTPETSALPVILISALTDAHDIVRGLELGANDYITKPVDVQVVMARVYTQLTLKRLMEERNQTIRNLQVTQEMRERFFRIAAHDLKGPLANMRLACHLLRTSTRELPGTQETLDALGMSLEKMQEVINDLLDSAAIQSGKLDLKIDCVPADRLMWDIMMQYEPAATRKEITLAVTSANGMAEMDYARMCQVMANLVSNAIKYSPRGSRVSLWSEERGNQLALCVADQGPGIPEAERAKLFGEFSKLSTRPTEGESSTGLGLWIVKHLVDLHKGEVGVDNREGGGSVFWVKLPLCQT
ncbi:MAG: hybrid sensor histidine kinase/response regulator [Chloroflexi bacterium]|nr:hybrid sensor histidine kinase/response regulator [Chloroflexota bacterium]